MAKRAMVCILCVGFLLVSLAAEAILTSDGLVLYLPFDEGSGDEAADLSESGKVGILGSTGDNLPKWVNGRSGSALEFDGETNFVEIQETPDFSFASDPGAMTIAAWVKVLATATDAHDQNRQPIVMKGFSGEWEYALYVYDEGVTGMSVWNNGGSGVSEPSGGLNLMDGDWHAVVGTFDSVEGVKVYVDGELVTEAAPNANIPGNGTRNVFVARREDGQFLNAVIDDVCMWNRALSQDEVIELMIVPLDTLAVHPGGRLASKWGEIKSLR